MGAKHSSQSSLERGAASVEGSASAADESNNEIVQSSSTIDSSVHSRSNEAVLYQRQHASYTPPSSSIKPLAHYIFLVHGWLGNDLEFDYLAKSFRGIISPSTEEDGELGDSVGIPDAKRVRRSGSLQSRLLNNMAEGSGEEVPDTEIIVHSVKCNVGKTNDGVRNGGTRLANEIISFIKTDVEKRLAGVDGSDKNSNEKGQDDENRENHVTFSLIGNSLGGLYSRYAVSLLPYQLQLQHGTLNMHPNVFCTTATPHLGVSRHTYLPIPRIAETIIGTGMGTTGRDLFRLNSEKDLASAAAGNIMNAAVGGVRRLSALKKGCRQDNTEEDAEGSAKNSGPVSEVDEEELQCVVTNMCLRDRFLTPLRNFRRRIAYANAYGTDFQVPTETAAFLNEKSGVGHFVVASRDLPPKDEDGSETKGEDTTMEGSHEGNGESNEEAGEGDKLPHFIVAVVRTEEQSRPQTPTKANGDGSGEKTEDELLRMSQSLDALGWTKVFIDVRDRIPVPGLAKPAWMRPPCGSLDDLIRERAGLSFASLQPEDGAKEQSDTTENGSHGDKPNVETEHQCILTSQELAQSTKSGDSINFPLGHTVMIANSKNEGYSQLNSQGRPVMEGLAEDVVRDVLDFER